jgi:hypothetical protein
MKSFLFNAVIVSALAVVACKKSTVSNPPVSPADSLLLHKLKFKSDYTAGTDANGQYRGGTELNGFVAHNGKLFATLGYWRDNPGGDPFPGAQILVKDNAGAPWRADLNFGSKYYSAEIMQEVSFTTDKNGNALVPAVKILLASPALVYELLPSNPPPQPDNYEGSIWSRNNTTNTWEKMVIAPNTVNARAIFDHFDEVTRVHYVFAAMRNGAIYRGVYDASVAGRIKWAALPEYTIPSGERILSGANANKVLYVSTGDDDASLTNGAIFKRTDGVSPTWQLVYQAPGTTASEISGIRGLTAVPSANGSYEVLLAAREKPGIIIRLDPMQGNIVTTEFDYRNFFISKWGSLGGNASLAAYNDMAVTKDPYTGEKNWMIGLWVNHPGRTEQPHNGSYYLVRDSKGNYKDGNVYDFTNPVPVGAELKATRAIIESPFDAEKGNVFYFGGYDAGGGGTKHNTAWIYKGSLK